MNCSLRQSWRRREACDFRVKPENQTEEQRRSNPESLEKDRLSGSRNGRRMIRKDGRTRENDLKKGNKGKQETRPNEGNLANKKPRKPDS